MSAASTANSAGRPSERDDQAQVRRRHLLTCIALGPHDLAIVSRSAVGSATSNECMSSASQTGAFFVPDFVAEAFRPETQHGGHDGADGRSLRYLEWTYDPDPADTTVVTLYAYLLREVDGSVRVLDDRHIEGIFPRGTWLRLLAGVGFRASLSVDEWEREVFVGIRW